MDTTSGYTKMSFSTMCAMLQYRGHDLSEAQLNEQWRYLKQVEDEEAHEKPMLCAQGCGMPVTRRKKGLSLEAQYELLRKSCCSACWMHAHFPQEYVRLGWDQGDEAREEPMLCAQGCGQPVPRGNKTLSPEAQYELLKNSCCTPCWMHTFFPEEYARLGWDKREAHHGGGCLQDLLKNQPRANKDIDAPEATEVASPGEGMRPIVRMLRENESNCA